MRLRIWTQKPRRVPLLCIHFQWSKAEGTCELERRGEGEGRGESPLVTGQNVIFEPPDYQKYNIPTSSWRPFGGSRNFDWIVPEDSVLAVWPTQRSHSTG